MLVYYNLDVIQGSTFSAQLSLKQADGTAVDLEGYSVRGHIKYKYGTNVVLLDLEPAVVTTGGFTAASGVVNITLDAIDTAALPVMMGVYDIETFNNDGEVNKVLDGKVRIHPEVTTSST